MSRDRLLACGAGACEEAGRSLELGYIADGLKESVPKRVRASISSEVKRTRSASATCSLVSASASPLSGSQ